MKKAVSTLTGLLLMVFTATSFSQRQEPYGGGMHGQRYNEEHKHRIWQNLNLSEAQNKDLKKLHEKHRTSMEENRDEIKNVRTQIKDELLKDKPNYATLEKYADKIATHHKKVSMGMNDHLLEMKKILNKEQFEKVLTNMGNRPNRSHEKDYDCGEHNRSNENKRDKKDHDCGGHNGF